MATAIVASAGDTAFLAVFVSGIATLILTMGAGPVGARLPVVQGTSLGFVVIAIPLAENFGLAAGGAGSEDFGSLRNLALAGLVLVVTIVLHQFTRGFTSAAAVLLGIVVGYVVAIPLGLVDGQQIVDASWFSFPTPLKFGLSFPLAALVGMSVMAVATTVDTIGDLSALTIGGAGREVTDRVPDTIRILLETGIVPAVFVAMALNVVLPDRTARHG